MFTIIIAAAAGFVVGAFTPSVGRKIKALFVKDSKVAVVAVSTDVKKVL